MALEMENTEDKKYFLPENSRIPNYLLVKMFSDFNSKKEKLAPVHDQIPSTKPETSRPRKCTRSCSPDNKESALYRFCQEKLTDWGVICKVAPDFKIEQVREFGDTVGSSYLSG